MVLKDRIDEKRSGPHTDATEADVCEVTGVIKWFDKVRGYGFIVPDNGLTDVFLDLEKLQSRGYQVPSEGSRIRCQVKRARKGLRVSHIISLDEKTASNPAQRPPSMLKKHEVVVADSSWVRVRVKSFNSTRGFGFLTEDKGAPDIFVHRVIVQKYGFTELNRGQVLQVRWGYAATGKVAVELRPDT